MPKIICPVCDGTLDANYDLPASEYVHYPCQSCKNGIKNYCKACDGKGTWWENYGYSDCGILQHCYDCNGDGYERDFVELEVVCKCCEDDPPKQKIYASAIREEFDWFVESVCAKCNGTKKVVEKFYEGSQEYENNTLSFDI